MPVQLGSEELVTEGTVSFVSTPTIRAGFNSFMGGRGQTAVYLTGKLILIIGGAHGGIWGIVN